MTNIHHLTVEEIVSKIKQKELTPSEVVEGLYKHIEAHDNSVQSFIKLTKEDALKEAKHLDELQAKDEMTGELFGLPVGIKDNILTKGVTTTAASKMLENFTPINDATVVKKLKDAETVSLGKINLDEFAMGSTTETSYYKKTTNAWSTKLVPGGSSGGSAAAVAAGFVPAALGTDTGGSIRQPASFNGVVGMKPTYGRVSRFGGIAFGSSFDTIGPITKTVKDNAILLNVLSGLDEFDGTTADKEADFLTNIDNDIKGMKIAVVKELMTEDVNAEVRESIEKAVETFKSLGAEVEEVSIDHLDKVISIYEIVSSSEAFSNLARFDGIRYGYRAEAENLEDLYKKTRGEGFGDEVKRRIILGTYMLQAGHFEDYFEQAQKVRRLVMEEFAEVLSKFDLILTPTTAAPAHEFGKPDDNVWMTDVLTIPANLTGLPALSVPCGLTEDNRPIGLQIIGNHYEESKIYNAAYKFEQQFNLHDELKNLTLEVK
ncbi:Asp-tRNA(Asn)/Glu-tRNA(Gln) amidotransferase subunit GatA [Nosocomiicoccus sp. HMSC09A07]|uniref:Asp-tRNA(Asn)/Glu-tRNA(Gln) amidotransferase subunit GatA n=1 Tax=Nosocomiicoccus sp. HMSC09A07 TaxID=1581145 RepID=UPI0008A1F3F7|nr:Asp-tRNA(Asn)/Glu-tRNA(Gln) amidotransferase subunit GatA [Nosocomiicoccus sp. HMSC09A07]OFS61377.1 aspartyl/glutamyl-tRNA amidotransferase subunit A [Nosocomiicoccus sp. HMSC09A07]